MESRKYVIRHDFRRRLRATSRRPSAKRSIPNLSRDNDVHVHTFAADSGTPCIALFTDFFRYIPPYSAATSRVTAARPTGAFRSCKTNYPRRKEERTSRRRTRILRPSVRLFFAAANTAGQRRRCGRARIKEPDVSFAR